MVEILLSISILALVTSALFGAFEYGRETTMTAGARTRALLLADEGIEASRNIRDSGFTNLTVGTHGLGTSGGKWIFSGTSDTTGIFTRQMLVAAVDATRDHVTSTVTWQETPSRAGSVTLDTYLSDWSAGPTITSCATYCQSLSFTTGTCRQNTVQCLLHGETHQSGGDVYCTGGPSADTCCCHP